MPNYRECKIGCESYPRMDETGRGKKSGKTSSRKDGKKGGRAKKKR